MLREFNAVNFTIFDIPGYFFFTGVGLVVAVSTFIVFVSNKKYPLQVNMRILMVSILFLIVFARVFGGLSGIYRNVGMGEKINWDKIKNTGIVFYGGLLGFLISYKICIRRTKQDEHIMDLLAVIIPLFHAIARVGCFVGGCCFGKESSSNIAIMYRTKVLDQINISQRIPIQLIEAAFNVCLFVYLFKLFLMEEWKEKKILRKYLLLYSVGRFVIEFFRGDIVRGMVCGISFGQMCSILIWLYLLITVKHRRKNKKMKEGLVI